MSRVCAICEDEIRDGEPHIKIEITHEENYWTAVAEPTVLAHAGCQDEMNLTFTSATTVSESYSEHQTSGRDSHQ